MGILAGAWAWWERGSQGGEGAGAAFLTQIPLENPDPSRNPGPGNGRALALGRAASHPASHPPSLGTGIVLVVGERKAQGDAERLAASGK